VCEGEDRINRVATEIERYLETHPLAADSLEGIAIWWLTQQRIGEELAVIRAALVRLADAGIISTNEHWDDRNPIYHLNRRQ